jgi:hypothetical protein
MNLSLLITPADFNLDDALKIAEAKVKLRASFSAMAVSAIDLSS